MKALVIVQSRLGSQRFPRKALADLRGKPLIAHVVEKAKRLADARVVLAVPYAEMEQYRDLNLGVDVYGAEKQATDDVLGRFVAVAAQNQGFNPLVRVTGDCPMWRSDIARIAINTFQCTRAEYVSNVHEGYEDGTDVEVFSRTALVMADKWSESEYDREHVTPWMRRNLPLATVLPQYHSRGKTSIDTPEDLERVAKLMDGLS